MQKSKEKLPHGVRMIIYSFLPMSDLLHKISKLSVCDRANLVHDVSKREFFKNGRSSRRPIHDPGYYFEHRC